MLFFSSRFDRWLIAFVLVSLSSDLDTGVVDFMASLDFSTSKVIVALAFFLWLTTFIVSLSSDVNVSLFNSTLSRWASYIIAVVRRAAPRT